MNADTPPNLEPTSPRVNRAHEFRPLRHGLLLLAALAPATAAGQDKPRTEVDQDREQVIARGKGLKVTRGDYERYLLRRFGDAFLLDLVFDVLLERECARLGLAKDARERAAKLAAQEPKVAGENAADALRQHEDNHLRSLRVAALVKSQRDPTEEQLRHEFDARFGVDGQRVVVRQIQVSPITTRRQLEKSAKRAVGDADVERETRRRIDAIRAELAAGTSFAKLLAKSDDPTTRTLLANPRYRDRAGIVENYNYQRFGVAFAEAVRKLAPGDISAPVRSSHGWHLIELVSRKTTKFEDVREQLVKLYRNSPVRPEEDRALRARLLILYEVSDGR